MPGEPFVPYGRQWIDDDDVEAVVSALRSDLLTTGPAIEAFESALTEATSAKFSVAVSSGTAALHLLYSAMGVGPGDDVVVPALTFAATANAALYCGARPVFADVSEQTGLVEASHIEAAITERTRLIVGVDYAGHPVDYDAVAAVASGRDVPFVCDAAHSLGATYKRRDVGSIADASTFSFHPVKAITTGEGGAVTTDREEIARSVRSLRSHGIVRDRELLRGGDEPWRQEMHALGLNYRLTDLQAALGTSQLRKLDLMLKLRRLIAERYTEAFGELDGVASPVVAPDVEHAWHLYVLRVRDATRRRAFFEELVASGLGPQIHYLPVYRHPYYEDAGYEAWSCPGAEDFYSRCISIPLYPSITDDDVERVIAAVRNAARAVL